MRTPVYYMVDTLTLSTNAHTFLLMRTHVYYMVDTLTLSTVW